MTTSSRETDIDDLDPDRWVTRGRTTLELRQTDGGEWLATQRGVDADGHGPSAAAAAAAYCRAIDARDE